MSLNAVLNILLRRWYIIALCLLTTITTAFVVLRFIPPRFEGKATVVVDLGQLDPATGQSGGGSRSAMNNFIAVANSQKLAEDVFDRLDYASDAGFAAQYRSSKAFGRLTFKEWGAKAIAAGFTSQPSFDGSNILVFTYKSANSLQSAALANAFANAFVALALDMRRSAAQQATQWLDPQIDKLRLSLEAAQVALADYRKSANVIPANVGQDSDVSLLNSITSELAQTKSEALKLETLLAAKDVNNAALAQNASSPLLDSLRTQLISTKTDLARADAEVGSHNAKVVSLNAIKQAIQQQIDVEIVQIRRRLSDKLSNLREQIAFLQQQLATQTKLVIQQQVKVDQMNNLVRAVDVDQDQLNVALKTAATTKLQSQASYSNVSVLDAAIPPETPAFPKKLPLMLAALGGGLVLGIAFALLGEIFDRRIRTLEDLAFALRLDAPKALSSAALI